MPADVERALYKLPEAAEAGTAVESQGVPWRELADWCVRVLRKDAQRRANGEKAS